MLNLAAVSVLAQKTARVQVNVKTQLAVVPAAGYGVHMSVYDNDFTPPDLPNKLKAAGVTALRYPCLLYTSPRPTPCGSTAG